MAVNWRLQGNLKVISAHIKKVCPKATVYSVGDASHQSRTSDHNPYNWGYGIVVSAIDVMIRNGFTKTDAKALVKALKGRSDIQYIIYDGVIWSRSWGWTAKTYTGKDKHRDHVHVSARHTKAADQDKRGVKFRPDPQPNKTLPKPAPNQKSNQEKARDNKPAPKAPVFPLGPNGDYHEAANPRFKPGVKQFQQQLKDRGWDIKADGFFGDKTTEVVRAFQKEKHLGVDGRVGPLTWKAIWEAKVTK